jgi:hypothetical protein
MHTCSCSLLAMWFRSFRDELSLHADHFRPAQECQHGNRRKIRAKHDRVLALLERGLQAIWVCGWVSPGGAAKLRIPVRTPAGRCQARFGHRSFAEQIGETRLHPPVQRRKKMPPQRAPARGEWRSRNRQLLSAVVMAQKERLVSFAEGSAKLGWLARRSSFDSATPADTRIV